MKFKLFMAFVMLIAASAAGFGQDGMMSSRSKTDPVKVGETAPDFSLTDENGKTVKLSSLKGTTILVFYRAYWCPFCLRQLADLRALKQAGDDFQMLAISPDPAERAIETLAKIAKDGKGELGFPLLSDPGSKTVNAYGVYDPTYAGQGIDGIPRPAIFILDKNRKVLWASISMDYKKRPSNDEIRAELVRVK